MTDREIRHLAFCLDGLRYSLGMAEIAANRIKPTLENVVQLHLKNRDTEAEVSSSLLDAWSLIDMCHRTRELVQSTPTLSQKLPDVQLFLRATSQIEDLRHYVQHFRNGISRIPESWSPLWGSLSWIPAADKDTCYTAITGNLLPGTTSYSISYDVYDSHFSSEITLTVGNIVLDIPEVAFRLRTLRKALQKWIEVHPKFKRVDASAIVFKTTVVPTKNDQQSGSTNRSKQSPS